MPNRAFSFSLYAYPSGGLAERLREHLAQHSPAVTEARENTVGPHKRQQMDPDGEGAGTSGPPLGKNLRTRTRGLRGPPSVREMAQKDHCGLQCSDGYMPSRKARGKDKEWQMAIQLNRFNVRRQIGPDGAATPRRDYRLVSWAFEERCPRGCEHCVARLKAGWK